MILYKEQSMSRCLGPSLAIVIAWVASFGTDAPLKAAQPLGGPAAKEPKPTIVSLAVDPAAEPRPALKYSFMTPLGERKPGNAAPFYYRAILAYVDYRARSSTVKGQPNFDTRVEAWMQAPLESFPKDEVRKAFQGFRAFDDLREAASRERCEWDWRLQDMEGPKSFEFMLEEIQQSRGLARCLAVKARLEIAEGRYEDAIDTFRIGFQLARDIATTPIIIPGLVGISITATLDEQVHAFIAAAKAPNLYWALTELPRPLIDLRPAVEFEVRFPPRIFPFLKDPEHAQHSPEQWAELVSQAYRTLDQLTDERTRDNLREWQSRLTATGLALRGYTRAKEDLIAAGYDAAKIEQMPVGQVLAVDEARQCRYLASESLKWSFLPYPEGWRRQKQAESALIRDRYLNPPLTSREAIPINALLLPATTQGLEAMIRRDVAVAADRVVEAIRMHAAQNGGKLPQTLADITVVPAPANPRLGTPFPYRLEGDKAFLEVRKMTEAPQPMQESDSIFEITITHDRH
jgi:tetratricopeptide (TPR) repeat protein